MLFRSVKLPGYPAMKVVLYRHHGDKLFSFWDMLQVIRFYLSKIKYHEEYTEKDFSRLAKQLGRKKAKIKSEMVHLTRLVSASGLSRETYLRKLISGVVPREAPPPDFFAMMRELHYIGNNLNQIAMKAHALGVIDAKHYDDSVLLFEEAVQKILSAVLNPVPMEH